MSKLSHALGTHYHPAVPVCGRTADLIRKTYRDHAVKTLSGHDFDPWGTFETVVNIGDVDLMAQVS